MLLALLQLFLCELPRSRLCFFRPQNWAVKPFLLSLRWEEHSLTASRMVRNLSHLPSQSKYGGNDLMDEMGRNAVCAATAKSFMYMPTGIHSEWWMAG